MNSRSNNLTNRLTRVFCSKIIIGISSMIILLSFCYLNFSPLLREAMKYASVFIGGISTFMYILRRQFSKQSFLLFLLFTLELVASLVNRDADISSFIMLYVRLIGLYLYLEMTIRVNTNGAIRVISNVLWLLVVINWATLICFPDGLYGSSLYSRNWFFGYDNIHIVWFLAAIMASFIDRKINATSVIKLIILLAITTHCVLICMSANSVVSYAILLSYLAISNRLNKIKIINYKNIFITYISINMLFVFFRIQKIFSWFIVGVLGKNLTFTERTIIWDRAIALIKKKPILGHGYEPASIMSEKLGSSYYTHAHNTILDICYKGGILSSLLFLWLLFSLKDCIKKCTSVAIRNFIIVSVFCLTIMMVFEARQEKIGTYVILALASGAESYVLSKRIKKGVKNEK